MTFPPKKAPHTPNTSGDKPEGGLVSTGNGGLKRSLAIKAAGLKPTSGVEKNVNLF